MYILHSKNHLLILLASGFDSSFCKYDFIVSNPSQPKSLPSGPQLINHSRFKDFSQDKAPALSFDVFMLWRSPLPTAEIYSIHQST